MASLTSLYVHWRDLWKDVAFCETGHLRSTLVISDVYMGSPIIVVLLDIFLSQCVVELISRTCVDRGVAGYKADCDVCWDHFIPY